MIALVLFLTCVLIALAIGVMAAWSDIKGLTIPNWHSAAIALSFFVAFILMHLLGHGEVFKGLYSHMISGGVVFAITATLFAVKAMGAGDSKLATAYAFWVGISGLPAFLFYMSLAVGVVGISALVLGKSKPFKSPAPGSWIARVQGGENKVPYGVAIVCGALACFVKLGYVGSVVLTFLTPA
ncbi:MAG: prepilin peptidase [Alphaproteobacteria bacterium]